jgi:hypothetical protein
MSKKKKKPEEMFNVILSHKGNVTQNIFENSSHSSQNGKYQKTNTINAGEGAGRKGTLVHSWKECKLV